MKQTGSSRQDQKLRTREEIIRAAQAEFIRSGFVAARLEDIARSVGVTKGTVIFHFATKENLFKAVVQNLLDNTPDTSEEARSIVTDCAAGELRALVSLTYRQIVTNPVHQDIFQLVISEAARFPGLIDIYSASFADNITSMFQSAFERGVRSGEFRPLDFSVLSEVLFGPFMVRLVGFVLKSGPSDLAAHIEMHCDVMLRGIRADGDRD